MSTDTKLWGWPWFAAAVVFVFLMPTNQSLWIDESTTALYSRTPTVAAFLEKTANEVNSDSQMPLGNFYYWVGSRISGTSEFGLRTLSALWIVVGALVLWRAGLHIGIRFLPFLFACHAFVWYYAGEVRPYAMQIGLSVGLVYALIMLNTSNGTSRGLNALLFTGPLLCATSMLAVVPFAVVVGISAIVLARQSWAPRKGDWIKIAISGGLMAIIGTYYAWTLALGKGAQTVGTWGVGPKNLALTAYELLGFGGFGPGRHELRELGLSGDINALIRGFIRPSAFGIAVLVLVYVWAGLKLLRRTRRGCYPQGRIFALAFIVIIASTVILIVLSVIVNFPFWGRHLAPLLPFVIIAVAIAAGADERDNTIRLGLPLTLCATLLCSSLILRFAPEHSRDDYRSAGRAASAALDNGANVWWSASIPPALYYSVPICDTNTRHQDRCVVEAVNLRGDQLGIKTSPDLVLISKPDLHDQGGVVRMVVQRKQLVLSQEFVAFRVFERRSQ